jgi:hypothetical protein
VSGQWRAIVISVVWFGSRVARKRRLGAHSTPGDREGG